MGCSRPLALQIVALPFALRDFGVALYWHERYASDPGARWLRTNIESLALSLPRHCGGSADLWCVEHGPASESRGYARNQGRSDTRDVFGQRC